MALASTRRLTIQGRSYQRGEPVDTSTLPADKVEQLMAQRVLRAPDGSLAPCVALRELSLNGRTYCRGEEIDLAGVKQEKVSQLLDHRMVGWKPVEGPPTRPRRTK